MSMIQKNIENLRYKIKECALKHHRNPNRIKLIAVSKTKPYQDIETAYQDAHQIDFGENYAQEFLEKHNLLKNHLLRWHFIGHLQSNKAKMIAGKADLIHTLDRLSLAQSLQKQCEKLGITQYCLIQIKVTDEENKTGCPMEKAIDLIKSLQNFPKIKISGLMSIGSLTSDREKTRKEFHELNRLKNEINKLALTSEPLTELSMGMSQDYDLAIAEGATYLRIGRQIFGERN